MQDAFPEAVGMRLGWEDLPRHLREQIERRLGGHVVEHGMARAGFSPAFAGPVRLENGDRYFLKATGVELNPHSPDIYRAEAAVSLALAGKAPVPRLVHAIESESWIALIYELIDGRNPTLPWRAEELERVVKALIEQFRTLTPSPIEAPPASDVFAGAINGFGLLASDPHPQLDGWSRRHLEALAGLEAQAPEASTGDTLLQLDLRADNIILADDAVYIVDWPSASIGAWWVDVLGMAPSVAMQGGPAPEDFLAAFPGMEDVQPSRIDAVLASIAGYFTHRALQPPAKGLPTLRPFQAAQGEVAREWLRRRLGWDRDYEGAHEGACGQGTVQKSPCR